MLPFLTGVKVATFLSGAVVGMLGLEVARSETARHLAVRTLAKGMMVKDSISEKLNNVKEDAEDIYAEAKATAQAESMDWEEFLTEMESQEDTEDQDIQE